MSEPWTVRGGVLQTPLSFPVVIAIPEKELRWARHRPVSGRPYLTRDGHVILPPGTAGSVVFISVGSSEHNTETIAKGGCVPNPPDPYKRGERMSVEFFSGLYPEFDLTTPQGRKAMVAKVRELKGTKSEGFTEAREVSPILDVAATVVGAQTILNQAGKDGQSLAPILTGWAKRHVPPSPLKLLLWFQRQVHVVPTEVADHVSTHDEGPSGYKVVDNKGFVLHSHDGHSVLLELLAIPIWLQRKLSHALTPFTAEPTAFDPWLAYNNVPKWGELTQDAAYEAYLAEWHERQKRYPTFEWPHGRKLLLELDLTKCSQRVMRDALSFFLSRQSIEWWTALFDASPHKISELDRWAVDKIKAIDKLEEEMYRNAHFDPELIPLCIKNALEGNALNSHRVMLASVAKTLTNTSLRKVFEKYALELVAKQHNGKERAEQLKRAFKSSTVKRDTMPCLRRTSGPLKCPYAGGNCTIKCAKALGIRADPNQTIASALETPATNLAMDAEAAQIVEDSHSRGELDGRHSVEVRVNKRTSSLEICYEEDPKCLALEASQGGAAACAMEW